MPRLLDEARVLHQRGDLAAAAARCEAVPRDDGDRAEALNLLGVIRAQTGNLEGAAGSMREALDLGPGTADAHNNLGLILHVLKRDEEAIVCFRQAILLRSRYAAALNNLGISLGALNKHQEAVTHYLEALAVTPGDPEVLNNLGSALHSSKRFDEAIERFQAALLSRADFVGAEVNLATSLHDAGRVDEAVALYRSVLDRHPGDAMAHHGLARALHAAKQDSEAISHYRWAIAIAPDLSDAHAALGAALQEIGRIDEARLCFERAIALDPRCPGYYLSLARAVRLKRDSPYLAAMISLTGEIDSFTEPDRIDLHFALAQGLSDAGEHERGFEQLLVANALTRRSIIYDEASALCRIERTRAIFAPELIRNRTGWGNRSEMPIFILGMPRSGSTLVEQILASHPHVVGAGEVDAFVDAGRDVGLFSHAGSFPEAVPHWTREAIDALGDRYVARLTALAGAGSSANPVVRVTDKMLSNFVYIGLIRMALPNARIIHACRDPIDLCLSCFSIQFETQNFTYDLGELGRHYAAYSRLMAHWRSVLPPGAMLEVQYENVVGDLETEARRIVSYCGLPWDDACLRFHETPGTVRTASAAQVRRPIYRDAVGRWRPDRAVLRPLLEGLGS